MKIAILYIATGKYIVFWKDFFESSEKNFIAEARKEYFVFTDADSFEYSDHERVHRIEHRQLGWPYDTLMRFHVFATIEDRLTTFDFIFFFNANMLFVSPVSADEFLPNSQTDDGLMVTMHPGYFEAPLASLPYEQKQTESTAFIPPGQGERYFMGGLNGGAREPYLELIRELKRRTQADLDHQIIARWHDESQLNCYMIGRHPRVLTPAFGYPEGRKLPFKPKIIIRDKNKYGGHSFLRNEKRSLLSKIFLQLKNLKKRL